VLKFEKSSQGKEDGWLDRNQFIFPGDEKFDKQIKSSFETLPFYIKKPYF
jgi:hypothetical protein